MRCSDMKGCMPIKQGAGGVLMVTVTGLSEVSKLGPSSSAVRKVQVSRPASVSAYKKQEDAQHCKVSSV